MPLLSFLLMHIMIIMLMVLVLVTDNCRLADKYLCRVFDVRLLFCESCFPHVQNCDLLFVVAQSC